ncbi:MULTISPECIES: hypothetical protein [Sphingobacterium]|uniref:hypothetical protein n=1 Tax=Sphingobacterium TaxID=28453 RepID=UPI000B9412B9|nr:MULTISPECIES: hypothetical protein [Sphingobacterium]OYD40241.1 hypothetical protein CHT99_19450 [Sphingobacterium cellulitidis]OYD46240.1 hypothetical protein CHU00_08800 [Sphingobacterium cellulitidis]WFB64534.1 hypothetical protein PZ892_04810 [Sphingobacterium sp. WM]
MFRLLHFLALFGYLNVLCLEVKSMDLFGSANIIASETLVEVVLEEVLDLSHADHSERLPEIIFDDYRIFSLFLGLIPLVLFFAWLVSRIYRVRSSINHPFYLSKTLCLPGYYQFLYRYRPF